MFNDQSIEIARLEQRARSGSRWFFWIAGLSLITSLIMLSGSNWKFMVSLGTTQLVTGIANAAAAELGNAGPVIAIVFDLLAAGLFVGFGVFAGKKHLWAYVVGMVLFGLDTLILILFEDWIGIVFHLLVIYWIFLGFNACRQLLTLEREAAQNQTSAANAGPPAPPSFAPLP